MQKKASDERLDTLPQDLKLSQRRPCGGSNAQHPAGGSPCWSIKAIKCQADHVHATMRGLDAKGLEATNKRRLDGSPTTPRRRLERRLGRRPERHVPSATATPGRTVPDARFGGLYDKHGLTRPMRNTQHGHTEHNACRAHLGARRNAPRSRRPFSKTHRVARDPLFGLRGHLCSVSLALSNDSAACSTSCGLARRLNCLGHGAGRTASLSPAASRAKASPVA